MVDADADRCGGALNEELEALRERVRQLEARLAPDAGGSHQHQEILTTILEATTDFVSSSTPDGQILYINSAGLRMVGLNPDHDPSGRRIEEFHPPAVYRVLAEHAIQRALEHGSYTHETVLLHKDGHEIPVSQLILAHRSADGELQFISTIIRDITEARTTEQALRASEHSFRTIVQASPMGMHIYRLEEDGRLIFAGANPAADQILGVDHDQFLGLTIEEAFPPLAQTEIPARYRRAAAEGKSWQTSQVTYEDERIKGAYEVYAFQTSPGRMVALFLDITERMRNEEERRRLEEQLRQAQKMEAIGQLAGGVAHDFNNLLTGISGYADLILEELDPASPIHPDLQEIVKAAERATDLTRQLLAFSRKQIIAPRVIDANDVLARSQRMLGRLIGEDIRLTVTPGHDLWAIRADPGQLHQVMVNLATNARDAMPEGGTLMFETRNATIDADFAKLHPGIAPGAYLLIAVSDTGQGMKRELCERIFEPFFTTKDPGRGTGLGLSTVYGIVKQNNGYITVYSEEGMGTTFKIYLPRCDEGLADALESPEGQPPGGDETILLVEDESVVRGLSQRMLKRLGYNVLVAASPREARRLCVEYAGEIHAMLTDVIMPESNGKQLFEQLADLRPDLGVLYMSGYTDDVIAHHGVLEEGSALLNKPFTSRELAVQLRLVLDARRRGAAGARGKRVDR